ncbi:MAG: TonB-dependent receptor, partial [Pseudomonadota bacterium]
MMSIAETGPRLRQGALRIALGLMIAGVTAPAVAQTAPMAIDVPEQPLSAAVAELGRETGLVIGVDAGLLAGRQSVGVAGTMTPSEALSIMITGTDLTIDDRGADGVILRPAVLAEPDEGAFLLDQILVQGELQTRTLQETQTSVAIITGEALERRSDGDLADIAERTAGVTTSFGNSSFVIRGIEESGFGTGTNGGTISVNIDGARVETANRLSSSTFSTWDLEQVEILRGPQSTQSGRNALAGVVEVRSKDPIYETEVKARLHAGNGDLFQGAAAFNLPLIEDRLALRFSADVERSNGFVENPFLGNDDQNQEERVTLRGSLRFDPTEDFSAILKFTHFGETAGLEDILVDAFPEERIYPIDLRETVDTQLHSINLRLGYDINDAVRIESETNYFTYDVDQFLDLDDTALITPPTIAGADGDNIEQEVKLLYEDERLKAVVGGFYTSITLEDEIILEAPAFFFIPGAPPAAQVAAITTRDADTTNVAFFGEAEYSVLPDLRVIAGGRYDRESVDTQSTTLSSTEDPALAALLPPANEIELSATFDAFLPKLGL